MTKLRVVVLLAVAALLLFPAMAFAQATPPDFPCRFHGTVTVDGKPVADGTSITAFIEGELVASTATGTTESDGPSAYAIKIKPLEGDDFVGKYVTFMIGADSAKETFPFEAGSNVELDLSVGEPTIPVTGITDVVVSWTEGNSTIEDGVLILYLGEQPEGPPGEPGADGVAPTEEELKTLIDTVVTDRADEFKGEPGEAAAGGIALPIVALVIAIIAAGVAVMSMRRRI